VALLKITNMLFSYSTETQASTLHLFTITLRPGINCKGKDVVEVVDDAGDEGYGRDGNDDRPEHLPDVALGQRQVVITVSRGPEVEA